MAQLASLHHMDKSSGICCQDGGFRHIVVIFCTTFPPGPISLKLIIDRVLALESDDIDITQLKWIILMVLFNQPGQEHASIWMEDLVMDDGQEKLH